MSEIEETADDDGTTESPPRLRRSLLGYKRTDVDQVLETRDGEVRDLEGELDARDAELTELRQDVAALWLAFAQHDRMIKGLSDAMTAALDASARLVEAERAPQSEPPAMAPEPTPAPPEPAAAAMPPPEPEATTESEVEDPEDAEPESGSEGPSVGRQLAELDEVLAAIEMATQTLEQTYSEEIEGADEPSEAPGTSEEGDEPPNGGTEGSEGSGED